MNHLIQSLKNGETVRFRPHGNSMLPIIRSGQLCTVEPLKIDPEVGDVVLCKVRGRVFLHKVSAVRRGQFQISNSRGHINGWTTQVFGKCVRIED